ncbi:MAG: anhydro-N-acetylmuramic acid kinase [Hamadaea sp.]|uniref:anhydro-N-acetylmuramic acid kinase n=1 Tax=Hamadaea sp. TaxID=2024425 RepID=UPI0018282E29|nr:anhydro-N-acetylmuramic acid kinase [Hamadaea sp.]NUR49356.1 anhydro-N-acetylmuramic acid kinase [Hamadaea sp.]NUR69445.1 anhydro-N-acetylmuramic acid kinase [Hamadaea sp.]NUT23392.1 anhydro-N-acetylmuramic acid kinase [Hamadaea sp.]
MRVLGLSSGTSYDGIDAALVDFEADGDTLTARLMATSLSPYTERTRAAIQAALPPNQVDLGAVCRLDTWIGQEFAEAAAAYAETGPELVCSHGQTLYHWVDNGQTRGTLQLGQPAWIAERTGLPVIADVRARDVAAGGQGAPLVAILDYLLLSGRPDAGALNIGGIANLTVPGRGLAYDTGPGNALIDAVARQATGRAYDEDGELARSGRVLPGLLGDLLQDPYYARRPPKSTGKELFHPGYLGTVEADPTDLLATVTELTAVTIAAEIAEHGLATVVVSGGGVRNGYLMERLTEVAQPAVLTTSAALGVPAESKEALLFALIGWLTAHGLAGSIATCTGARTASVLGSVTGPLEPRTATMPARLIVQP